MTAAEFVKEVEACFGEYAPSYRKYVYSSLVNVPEARIQRVFDQVVRTYSTRWGRPPGIPEITECDRTIRNFDTSVKTRQMLEAEERRMISAPESVETVSADEVTEILKPLYSKMARRSRAIQDGTE